MSVDGWISAVTKVCNTPGYLGCAEFVNVRSDDVVTGEEQVALAGDGAAVFTSSEERRRVRQWQLAPAVRVNPAAR